MSSFSVKNCSLDPSQGGLNVDDSVGGDLSVDCYPINYTSCQLNSNANNSRPSIDRLIHGSSNLDDEISDSKNQHSPTHSTPNVASSANRTPSSRTDGKKQQQQQQQQATALLHLYSHPNTNSQSVTSSIANSVNANASDSNEMHHQLVHRTALHHQLSSSDHIYDMPHRMNQLALGNSNVTNPSAIGINEGSIILLNNPSHSHSQLIQQMAQHPHHSSLHLHGSNLQDSQSEFEFELASTAFHSNTTGQHQQQFIQHNSQSQSNQGSNHKQNSSDLNNRLDFVHIFDCPS